MEDISRKPNHGVQDIAGQRKAVEPNYVGVENLGNLAVENLGNLAAQREVVRPVEASTVAAVEESESMMVSFIGNIKQVRTIH